MARKLDLMGTSEIARRLGVSRQRASQLTAHPNFPSPASRLAMGPVWRRRDVERWIEWRDAKAEPEAVSR